MIRLTFLLNYLLPMKKRAALKDIVNIAEIKVN
jgi:hypothetical protein